MDLNDKAGVLSFAISTAAVLLWNKSNCAVNAIEDKIAAFPDVSPSPSPTLTPQDSSW